MIRMCEKTGRKLSGTRALQQAISRTLRTPKGLQVANRSFGSNVPSLLDQPIIIAATAIKAQVNDIVESFGVSASFVSASESGVTVALKTQGGESVELRI